MEVLSLVAEGLTNAEIALRLFTSKRTVETHRQNIMEKTQHPQHRRPHQARRPSGPVAGIAVNG